MGKNVVLFCGWEGVCCKWCKIKIKLYVKKKNVIDARRQGMVSSTCAIRIPVTIASWCSVPSAPRRLVGAISPTYMGVKPEANPTSPNKRKQ